MWILTFTCLTKISIQFISNSDKVFTPSFLPNSHLLEKVNMMFVSSSFTLGDAYIGRVVKEALCSTGLYSPVLIYTQTKGILVSLGVFCEPLASIPFLNKPALAQTSIFQNICSVRVCTWQG